MTPTRAALWQDDEALVARTLDGEREAFGELVTRHQRRVWLVCRQYVGTDEADALTQDCFVKAFGNLHSYDGRAAFTTWLTRIAINSCLDALRRRRREGLRAEPLEDEEGPLERLPDTGADPEQHAIQRQAVTRLRVAEERLPERQRRIFRLRFYGELELAEIAEALEVHVGTVKTQLHRAVHRLRQELGDVR